MLNIIEVVNNLHRFPPGVAGTNGYLGVMHNAISRSIGAKGVSATATNPTTTARQNVVIHGVQHVNKTQHLLSEQLPVLGSQFSKPISIGGAGWGTNQVGLQKPSLKEMPHGLGNFAHNSRAGSSLLVPWGSLITPKVNFRSGLPSQQVVKASSKTGVPASLLFAPMSSLGAGDAGALGGTPRRGGGRGGPAKPIVISTNKAGRSDGLYFRTQIFFHSCIRASARGWRRAVGARVLSSLLLS